MIISIGIKLADIYIKRDCIRKCAVCKNWWRKSWKNHDQINSTNGFCVTKYDWKHARGSSKELLRIPHFIYKKNHALFGLHCVNFQLKPLRFNFSALCQYTNTWQGTGCCANSKYNYFILNNVNHTNNIPKCYFL